MKKGQLYYFTCKGLVSPVTWLWESYEVLGVYQGIKTIRLTGTRIPNGSEPLAVFNVLGSSFAGYNTEEIKITPLRIENEKRVKKSDLPLYMFLKYKTEIFAKIMRG